jgi:hypothetical protein
MVVLSVRGPSLFPLSFFALRNFEFPAKIKKGGGKTHRTPYLLRPWRSDIPPPFPVGSWETLAEESLQMKEKAEKNYFYLRHIFWKREFIPRFSASPNLFYRSQKPKKNYGRHPFQIGESP